MKNNSLIKPQLFFDGTCPVCTNYVKVLKRKISPKKLDYLPLDANSQDFLFVTPHNHKYKGKQAINKLIEYFPEVKSYFWMLPEKYKVKALQAAYAVGGAVRNVLTKKKGCGCGKR